MASVASCASPHRHPRACRHPRQLAPPPRLAARVPLADQRACRPRRRPDFEIVERVVAEAPNEDDLPPRFLVKWRSLPYANCTWESCRTLLPYQQAIERCRNSEQQPSANERKMATSGARPPKTSFKQLAKTPTYKAGHTLRSYQLEGLNWLLFSWYNRRSVMLADEMGLGKTVQSVTTLHHIWQHEGIRGPFLVLAPLSTLSHWLREFEGWTDMNTIVYHGSNESRELIRDVEFSFADPPKSGPPMYKFQVLITSYEVIKQDLAVFKKIPWRYMVVDEAHRLKNKVRPPRPAATRRDPPPPPPPHRPHRARPAHRPLAPAADAPRAVWTAWQDSALANDLRQLSIEHMHLLSGTPLQNNTTELWALLYFLDPQLFPSLDAFLDEFGTLTDSTQVDALNERIRPYLLRRQKGDVEKSLIPLEETIIWVEMTLAQASAAEPPRAAPRRPSPPRASPRLPAPPRASALHTSPLAPRSPHLTPRPRPVGRRNGATARCSKATASSSSAARPTPRCPP